jgi:hypothetical protein
MRAGEGYHHVGTQLAVVIIYEPAIIILPDEVASLLFQKQLHESQFMLVVAIDRLVI